MVDEQPLTHKAIVAEGDARAGSNQLLQAQAADLAS